MITLHELKDELPGELVFVEGDEHKLPYTVVSGVHISELEDPTSYINSGDLLLTIGLAMEDNPNQLDPYVQRLSQQKICALGFGLGPVWDRVPTALVAACKKYKVELLLVPDGVPFQKVTTVFWALNNKSGTDNLERSLGIQAALAREITRPDGIRAVVRGLAQSLGGWAIFDPQDGSAEAVWPESAQGALQALRAFPERMKRADVNAVVSFEFKGQMVLKFPVAAGEQLYGSLAVCPSRKLETADKYVIRTVVALLMMKVRQQQSYSAGVQALGDAVVRLLVNGHADAARILSENVGLGELPAHMYVLGLTGDDRVDESEWIRAVPALERAPGVPCLDEAASQTRFVHRINNTLFLLFSEKQVQPETHMSGLRGYGAGSVSGVIVEPVTLSDIPAAVLSVRRAIRRAPLGKIIKAGARDRVLAEDWVSALIDYSRADLVTTVTAYIKHRGQWEPTSRELGVHRNSVRHRIENAEKLLGVSLDDPNVFAPLWLALRDRIGD